MILCIIGITGKVNAQQQVNETEAKTAKKGIKLNLNAGFHFSNMIGKDVQKNDNIFISAYNLNTLNINDYPPLYNYECYGLYAGGYKGLLPGYKFGLGITFDVNNFFAWGFDLNFETKGCLIPIKEIITSYYITITYPVYTSNLEEKRVEASKLYSKIRLNYIVVPIRTEFKYKKFYCMPGMYVGFLLNAPNTTKFDYRMPDMYKGFVLDDINTTKFDDDNLYFDIKHNVSSHYAFIDCGVFLNMGFCFPFLEKHFIKIGLVGEWNVSGTESRKLIGAPYSFFSNQVLGLELKYEFKIKQ